MKSLPFIILLAALALIFTTCEKPARDNPWDELAILDPQSWAPKNIQISNTSIKERSITWEYTGDDRIEGFKIDRKRGSESWVEGYAKMDKDARTFNDTITPDKTTSYQYRVYAHAGPNKSLVQENTSLAAIPEPTNLNIIRNSITSATLSWQYNLSGIQGFNIYRKQASNDWELLANQTQTSFVDDAFILNTFINYKVTAYYGEYHSSEVDIDFNSQIPAPQNLTITANSTTSVTLNWNYNLTGHEGFKIDRKVNGGAWLEEFVILNFDQTNHVDEEVDINNRYTYRVYTYFAQHYSNKEEIEAHVTEIGENYAGGIVFYLDGNGGGLVCAESDQSSGSQWGCYGTTIGGTGTGIGTGAANTAAIVAGCNEAGIAARICNDLVLNGYSDWFLPSKDELNLMYQNLKVAGIGGFAGYFYWSSSEGSSISAWLQSFNFGNQKYYTYKNYSLRVRAVRAF